MEAKAYYGRYHFETDALSQRQRRGSLKLAMANVILELEPSLEGKGGESLF